MKATIRTVVLLTAALAAAPATAEVYECRSSMGDGIGVEAEAVGPRLAIHDGRKVTVVCGARAGAGCSRMGDGGYAYAGPLGTIQFVPEGRINGAPAAFLMRAPGETVSTRYMCRPADAAVRRRFRRSS